MILKLAREKTKRIVEPNRETWIQQTHDLLQQKGFRTIGKTLVLNGVVVSDHTPTTLKLDRMLGMPNLPLKVPKDYHPETVAIGQYQENCQFCEVKLETEFVDAVVKGARGAWATMCRKCHRENGIGSGLGRAQIYVLQEDGLFHKVPHDCKSVSNDSE